MFMRLGAISSIGCCGSFAEEKEETVGALLLSPAYCLMRYFDFYVHASKGSSTSMKYEDWKRLATVCSVLSGLLLLGAYVAYMFPKTYEFYAYSITKYPYRGYAIPLFALAVVFIVIGISFLIFL